MKQNWTISRIARAVCKIQKSKHELDIVEATQGLKALAKILNLEMLEVLLRYANKLQMKK